MSNKDETVEAVPLAMPAIDASPWQGCKRVCLARILVGKGIHEFDRIDWLGQIQNGRWQSVWPAFGESGSRNFDANGHWTPR